MARPSSKHPTELELEILKILWREGPLPVSQVRDALAGFRDLAVTSVTTIMNIMVRKRYLTRERPGPNWIYRPHISQKATTRRMLKDLVDRVFDGSTAAVMAHLLETADLSERELKRIRALISQPGGDNQ